MMKNTHHVYEMTVTTKGPVHVGSGHIYSNKEFIYENGSYYFPNMGKLYQELTKIGKDRQFESFLMENKNGDRLFDFLKKHQIRGRQFSGYRIAATGDETGKPWLLNEVRQFMRDGLGQVYLPGSSLKGAIRTILINTNWKDNEFTKVSKVRKRDGREIKTYSEDKSVIPWGAKKNKLFDDIFHHIRVSDSQVLTEEDLVITQKWDYSPKRQNVRALPVYRESIKPGTKLVFTITATSSEADKLIKNLTQYAQEFYQGYFDFYLRETKTAYQIPVEQAPLYLGAGSGVWTKTKFDEAIKYVPKRYSRMKTKMIGKGVMKLTKASPMPYLDNAENFFEMGKCEFTLKKL